MRRTLPLGLALLLGAGQETEELAGAWIRGDVEAGFAEAKRSGRPLAVFLRCVP